MCLGNLQCLDYRQHSSREAGPNPERGWSKVFLRPAAFGWDFVGGGGARSGGKMANSITKDSWAAPFKRIARLNT